MAQRLNSKKVLFLIAFLLVLASEAMSKDLYVASNGNDSITYADNNLDRPWRTVNYGVKTMEAGDALYIRGGTYLENVTISSGGTNESTYKIIRNYPGETPILDAKNGARGVDVFNNVNYVKIIGLEIKNATDWGIASWYNHNNSFISVENCNIHHNGDGKGSWSVYEGGITFHAGPGNTLGNIVIDNNEIHHNYRVAIFLYSEGITQNISVSNNLLYRNPDLMLPQGDVYQVWLRGVTNASIHDNYVYFSQKSSRGEQGTSNNIFYNNVFAYSGFSGLDLNDTCNNNLIENNIFAFNNVLGANPKTKSNSNQFYHNIFYLNGYAHLMMNNNAIGTKIENNIFYGGRVGFELESGSSGAKNYNDYYDLLYASGNTPIAQQIGSGKGEPNSLSIDPQFSNASGFDFNIKSPGSLNSLNNPKGKGTMIGLYSNFVGSAARTRMFPYIPLTVVNVNYDISGANKTADHRSYSDGYAWHSNSSSGWIIYDCGGVKKIKYIGISGGTDSTSYYSPKDFHISVSRIGTGDADFTKVLDATYVKSDSDAWTAMAQWFELPNVADARYIKLTLDNSQKDYSGASNPNVQVMEFYAIGPREDATLKSISTPTGLRIKEK